LRVVMGLLGRKRERKGGLTGRVMRIGWRGDDGLVGSKLGLLQMKYARSVMSIYSDHSTKSYTVISSLLCLIGIR
jgi:hypothetical protein